MKYPALSANAWILGRAIRLVSPVAISRVCGRRPDFSSLQSGRIFEDYSDGVDMPCQKFDLEYKHSSLTLYTLHISRRYAKACTIRASSVRGFQHAPCQIRLASSADRALPLQILELSFVFISCRADRCLRLQILGIHTEPLT